MRGEGMSTSSGRPGWRLGGIALAMAMMAQAAHAQTGTPSGAGDKPSQAGGEIADIIVTAQRRSENLQNVPIAVTAATADMLQARGATSTREIIAAVPSVTVVTTAGYLQPRIRGIGNAAVGPGFEGGVAVYVDGVYQAAPQANLFSLSNIDRVEVLKGPQGTLFGRNTTGGLIQIITKEPSQTFGGTASFSAANYQDYTGDIYLTGGLADGLAMNVAGHAEFQGKGWGKNEYTGGDAYRTYHDIAVRSSILYESHAGTKIRITGDYSSNYSNISQSTTLAPGTGFPFPALVLPKKQRDINNDVQPFGRVHGGGVTGQITQDLGFASLISITAWRKTHYHLVFDGDATNVNFRTIDITEPDRQFSQEVQLASATSSPIKWVAGVFYFDDAARFDPQLALIGPVGRPVTPLGPVTGASISDRLGTRSLAGYAQATVPLGSIVNLTGGLRYTHERKSISDISTSTYFATLPAPLAGAPIASQAVKYDRLTWRASLDHRFSPELLVYASYNRGFKSGGFNGQTPTDPPYKPESIDAYEVGAKTDLFDRHLRIDASAFYYNYRDIQVTRYTGTNQTYYNGAAARVYGLDVDFEARLSRSLTLSGGMTVMHDRFTSFPNAIISTQVPTGVLVTTGSAKGNRLPQTADFSATITANYHVPVSVGELGLDVSYTYNDGYYMQPDNILRQPSYDLLSAGIGLTLRNGLSGRLWGRNLLNTTIFNTLQAGGFDSNASYQAPRTYGVTVGVKF